MKYYLTLLAVQVAGVSLALAQFNPKGGLVPDADTAIKIAVTVWSPIYGATHIANERPYHATLKKGVWIVKDRSRKATPEGWREPKLLKRMDGFSQLAMESKGSDQAMTRRVTRRRTRLKEELRMERMG